MQFKLKHRESFHIHYRLRRCCRKLCKLCDSVMTTQSILVKPADMNTTNGHFSPVLRSREVILLTTSFFWPIMQFWFLLNLWNPSNPRKKHWKHGSKMFSRKIVQNVVIVSSLGFFHHHGEAGQDACGLDLPTAWLHVRSKTNRRPPLPFQGCGRNLHIGQCVISLSRGKYIRTKYVDVIQEFQDTVNVCMYIIIYKYVQKKKKSSKIK